LDERKWEKDGSARVWVALGDLSERKYTYLGKLVLLSTPEHNATLRGGAKATRKLSLAS